MIKCLTLTCNSQTSCRRLTRWAWLSFSREFMDKVPCFTIWGICFFFIFFQAPFTSKHSKPKTTTLENARLVLTSNDPLVICSTLLTVGEAWIVLKHIKAYGAYINLGWIVSAVFCWRNLFPNLPTEWTPEKQPEYLIAPSQLRGPFNLWWIVSIHFHHFSPSGEKWSGWKRKEMTQHCKTYGCFRK